MTDDSPGHEGYNPIPRLAEAGRYEEALVAIQRHLFDSPKDGEALNDAGAILHALGRFDEAAEHLKRALAHLEGDPAAEALRNLAEVYLSSDRPAEAEALFGDLAKAGVLSAELANRAVNGFLKQADPAGAVEALLRSLEICPGQAPLVPVLEKLRNLRAKIAMFHPAGLTKAMGCVHDFLAKRFQLRLFQGESTEELTRMLHWCDIAWFEDCTRQLAIASKAAKRWRIVCRLRLEGAYSPWVEQVHWENVDLLIAPPNQAILGYFSRRVPELPNRNRIAAIPDGVDTARFAFQDRPRGRNLACIGRVDLLHNPMFLLQCFRQLRASDGQYRLFFAGMFTDDRVEQYLRQALKHMGLSGAVSFDGYQEDLPAWLADKHYVVSAEVASLQPTSVLEAMACGLRPVVHRFPGAQDFLGDDYLFATPEDFCRQIVREPYEPTAYRDMAAGRFELNRQLATVNGMLRELEKMPSLKVRPGASPVAAPAAKDGAEA